ncbi:MAG TPA: NADH-quinone oxidoreductase subunit L, partial [Bacteroidia bacterium]|nr:NADH-quinone oxidoreductase subunit L [Bacteroidia bacterium]
IAFFLYKSVSDFPERISNALGAFFKATKNKFYIDEIYVFVTKKIVFNLIGRPAAWIDRNMVDGFMNMLGAAAQVFSFSISGVQSGKVQNYAAYFLTGVIGLALLFIYIWIH